LLKNAELDDFMEFCIDWPNGCLYGFVIFVNVFIDLYALFVQVYLLGAKQNGFRVNYIHSIGHVINEIECHSSYPFFGYDFSKWTCAIVLAFLNKILRDGVLEVIVKFGDLGCSSLLVRSGFIIL
jgi:hypothetical protein